MTKAKEDLLMFKNALISVANKNGLVEFVKPLAERGLRIVSTGGTAKLLMENGIQVIKVSDQTGFPEVMDGRVKTLHPRIHMALLGRQYIDADMKTLEDNDLQPFDLVVGNLYAFEEALQKGPSDQELQEFIDIGGPSFLRAAAKNFASITTICDPRDYDKILAKTELNIADRKELASKVFYHTSAYDSMVAKALCTDPIESATFNSIGGELVDVLRYGENPDQKASWCRTYAQQGLHQCEILNGKQLSYNNLLDLDAAISTLNDFDEPTCVSVKHNNPCGIGSADDISEATRLSLGGDPVSVFGGIIALNRGVNVEVAEQLKKLFLECVVAPEFTEDGLSLLKEKGNLRLLKAPQLAQWKTQWEYRQVLGGFLVQESDSLEKTFSKDWEIVGERPSPEIQSEMLFAMKTCAHLKSNAIALTCKKQSIGLGMGQVNRVDAVEQAILRAKKFHSQAKEVVLASDAFFPFADSIEIAHKAGIQWVIQPGGSIKDAEVKAAVEKYGMGMVLTGKRHFKH